MTRQQRMTEQSRVSSWPDGNVLQQVRNRFQSNFSAENHLVFPLSVPSIFWFPLSSYCSLLRLLPPLPVTSVLPYIFPLRTYFRTQFLCKMWPLLLAFLCNILYRIFLSSLTLCNISFFSQDRSNWTSPSFRSTTFLNFQSISDLFYEVSKFHHHAKLCSRCKLIL